MKIKILKMKTQKKKNNYFTLFALNESKYHKYQNFFIFGNM